MYSSGFQSCFYSIKWLIKICFIYRSIENVKLYNLFVGHVFRFCFYKTGEAIFCGAIRKLEPSYNHIPLAKVVQFSTSVSQMKDLIELCLNPKYLVAWFCCWEKIGKNVDFRHIFLRKTMDLPQFFEYFLHIFGAVQLFSLGVVLNVRAPHRLQTRFK